MGPYILWTILVGFNRDRPLLDQLIWLSRQIMYASLSYLHTPLNCSTGTKCSKQCDRHQFWEHAPLVNHWSSVNSRQLRNVKNCPCLIRYIFSSAIPNPEHPGTKSSLSSPRIKQVSPSPREGSLSNEVTQHSLTSRLLSRDLLDGMYMLREVISWFTDDRTALIIWVDWINLIPEIIEHSSITSRNNPQ